MCGVPDPARDSRGDRVAIELGFADREGPKDIPKLDMSIADVAVMFLCQLVGLCRLGSLS